MVFGVLELLNFLILKIQNFVILFLANQEIGVLRFGVL